MNNKIIILITIALFLIPLTTAEITYPISQLGNCNSKEECKLYCEKTENIEVCLDFAEENSLMSKEELERAKKFLPYLLKGETPGGCKEKAECDNYCRQEENLEECIEFALKVGDISEEEAEMARKTGGKGPGGCKGPIECDAYCNKDENLMECVEFAYKYGMIDEEEYELIKKTGGKGPGGCKGEEECNTYCKEHEQECMEFAIKYGLMPEEDIERMENLGKEEKCIMDCLMEAGVDPRECGPSEEGEKGGSACRKCADKCVDFYEGPCLTEKQWREKEQACMSQGEHMEARPIEGEDPKQGRKCTVDIECIDRSNEWGDKPGEGPGIGEEQKAAEEWDKEHGGPGEENMQNYENYMNSQQEQTQQNTEQEQPAQENTNPETEQTIENSEPEVENEVVESSEPELENTITAETILTGKVIQIYESRKIKMIFR